MTDANAATHSIVIERVMPHPPERIWRALTQGPTFVAHGTLAALLAGFIVLHVLAALFHQFVLKDGLLRRMLFGRRGPNSSAQVK